MDNINQSTTSLIRKLPIIALPILIISVSVLGWLSRGDWIYPEQINASHVSDLELIDGVQVGQSFVASQAGLEALEVKIHTFNRENTQPIILHLRDNATSETDIRQATQSAQVLTDGQWTRFAFEPLSNSRQQYYYFFLESPTSTSGDAITIYYGPTDSYLDGSLYFNSEPQSAQISFRAVYNRQAMVMDLLTDFIFGLPRLLAVLIMLIIPGASLLAIFHYRYGYGLTTHWAETLAVAVGLSLSLYPLVVLWTDLIGLHLGFLNVWLPITIGTLILIGYSYQIRDTIKPKMLIQDWLSSDSIWADFAFIVVLLLAGLGRFLMARGLDMPLWNDSVHHAVIVQRIIENGGLFQSWQPYTPYHTFTFHFGFHVNTAILAWTTGLDTSQAMIWAGQLFNFSAVLALYPLAYRIKGVWAGIATVLIAGLFTQFPTYYTNWGRFPQLMGQVILPFAAWWTVIVLQEARLKNALAVFYGAMLITASLLSYYRMSFHYIAFVVAVFIVLYQVMFNWRNWLTLTIAAGVVLLLMLPWGLHIAGRFDAMAEDVANRPVQVEVLDFWQTFDSLKAEIPTPKYREVLLLGLLLIIWYSRIAALPVVWLWLLISLPYLKLTPFPGSDMIHNFTISISIYIAETLILGIFIGYLGERWLTKYWWSSALLAMGFCVAGLFMLPEIPNALDRDFDLSTRPDMRAAEWIKENLPPDAFFLINGIVYTDGYSAIAGDAGTWLPLLTQRQTTIPPQYALLLEVPEEPGYSQTVNQLVQQLVQVLPNTPEAKTVICQFPSPISHVYIGQRHGLVDKALPNPTPRTMLPAQLLIDDPAFTLIYHQDRVMIFEFDRAVCS